MSSIAIDCAIKVGGGIKTDRLIACKSVKNAKKKTKNYSTSYSRAVPHHSTDDAITSLTLLIGREVVLSRVYGRS